MILARRNLTDPGSTHTSRWEFNKWSHDMPWPPSQVDDEDDNVDNDGDQAAGQPVAQDDDNDDDDVGPAGKSGRTSKSELYKAYVSKGPHAMYCDIMSDQKLRPAAELIVRISNPLHLKYAEDLETQQQGSTAILEWNVFWQN